MSQYEEAFAELQQILAELENAKVDIDVVADKVARARTLIKTCRDRITAASVAIDEIVSEPADKHPDLVDTDGEYL